MSEMYKEIMDQISVTQEMRTRILTQIRNQDFQKTSTASRSIPLHYLAVAACLTLLLAGAIASPYFRAPIQSDPPGIQTGVPNRVQAASLSELSQLVGFDVEELECLPFDVVETQYTAYQNELAEVTYLGENQTLIFRKLPGSSDPSGDYTDYSDTLILELGLGSVTLRGESGTYVLAAWQDGTYAYSMKSSQPWSQEQWMELLAAIG